MEQSLIGFEAQYPSVAFDDLEDLPPFSKTLIAH